MLSFTTAHQAHQSTTREADSTVRCKLLVTYSYCRRRLLLWIHVIIHSIHDELASPTAHETRRPVTKVHARGTNGRCGPLLSLESDQHRTPASPPPPLHPLSSLPHSFSPAYMNTVCRSLCTATKSRGNRPKVGTTTSTTSNSPQCLPALTVSDSSHGSYVNKPFTLTLDHGVVPLGPALSADPKPAD